MWGIDEDPKRVTTIPQKPRRPAPNDHTIALGCDIGHYFLEKLRKMFSVEKLEPTTILQTFFIAPPHECLHKTIESWIRPFFAPLHGLNVAFKAAGNFTADGVVPQSPTQVIGDGLGNTRSTRAIFALDRNDFDHVRLPAAPPILCEESPVSMNRQAPSQYCRYVKTNSL